MNMDVPNIKVKNGSSGRKPVLPSFEEGFVPPIRGVEKPVASTKKVKQFTRALLSSDLVREQYDEAYLILPQRKKEGRKRSISLLLVVLLLLLLMLPLSCL